MAMMRACVYLLEVVGGDVVCAGLGRGFLQAAQASLQRSHEALPQVVHGAGQFISHGLVEPDHNQILDLTDAHLDVFRAHGLRVRCHDDVCNTEKPPMVFIYMTVLL